MACRASWKWTSMPDDDVSDMVSGMPCSMSAALADSRSSTKHAKWFTWPGSSCSSTSRMLAGSHSCSWMISSITGPHWPKAALWS